MSVFRKILFAKSVFALLASQQIVAQTVHYAINDSGANEIGIQSTPGAGCTLPFDGDGGSFVNAYAGDEPQTEKTHTWFGIFSFNTEGEGWVAGGTYQLFIQERDREGTPFQDLGKMLIEYTDNDEPFPDRFGQAGTMTSPFRIDSDKPGICLGRP